MKIPGGNVQKETVSGEALRQEQAQVGEVQGHSRLGDPQCMPSAV